MEAIEVDLFSEDSDSEEELGDYLNILGRKPYLVRERPNHLNLWDEEEFRTRFRISKITTMYLVELIEHIIRFPTERNSALTPLQQLLITLRFYAAGSFLKTVGDFGGVHETTVSAVVKRVSEAICSLKYIFISMPEGNEIAAVQQEFYNIAAFPRVILAVDGTHVRIQSPGGDLAEQYRNRKGYFSLNIQVACDHKLRIRNIVARWPGSSSDSLIFLNSRLKATFDEGMENCLILGDSGYPSLKYLMTPVLEPRNRAERLYNESHIRTRNCIERTIGVWKRRFPVLSLGLRVGLETVQDIVVATAILNNIAINQNEEELPADEQLEQVINVAVPVENQRNNRYDAFRQELINNYFNLL